MDSSRPHKSSFVVWIEVEKAVEEGDQASWRGRITQVFSDKQYDEVTPVPVKALDDIGAYIASYLEEMGVRIGLFWRIRRWLRREKATSKLQSVNNDWRAPLDASLEDLDA